MSKVFVFTSAARNYTPKARLLFQSLRKHHPEWVLCLALGDALAQGLGASAAEFDEILPLEQLGIPNWRGWAFCHTVVELCTAIKPFALRRLLQREPGAKVLYFDPDIVAFSRLDDLLAALDDGNIVLTPHLTVPERSLEAVMDNEICSLRHGIYNLGFIGVRSSDEGRRFADWWASRTLHFCREDIPNGLFTDQRWIDLAPAFFEGVTIMRSSRHNVATWNIATRRVTIAVDGGFLVDGEPLGFYHFTGFDSGAHLSMAQKYASDSPAVFGLIKWYEQRIGALGRDPIARTAWAFDVFSNGEPISPAQRIIYRERPDLQAAFPDPFDEKGYLQWWKVQVPLEYPRLLDADHAAEELRRIASSLTPGFGRDVGGSETNVEPLWSRLLASPKQTIRRGWEVLRTRGAGR